MNLLKIKITVLFLGILTLFLSCLEKTEHTRFYSNQPAIIIDTFYNESSIPKNKFSFQTIDNIYFCADSVYSVFYDSVKTGDYIIISYKIEPDPEIININDTALTVVEIKSFKKAGTAYAQIANGAKIDDSDSITSINLYNYIVKNNFFFELEVNKYADQDFEFQLFCYEDSIRFSTEDVDTISLFIKSYSSSEYTQDTTRSKEKIPYAFNMDEISQKYLGLDKDSVVLYFYYKTRRNEEKEDVYVSYRNNPFIWKKGSSNLNTHKK